MRRYRICIEGELAAIFAIVGTLLNELCLWCRLRSGLSLWLALVGAVASTSGDLKLALLK